MLKEALYRIGQVTWALKSLVTPVDYGAVSEVLSPELVALFRRMRRSEQHHGLRVMQTLQAQGHTYPDLLAAALLHDVGKSRYPFTLFDRVLAVAVKKLAPRRFVEWGSGEPRGWRRPFVVACQHPAWSADDMAAAEAGEVAVALARRHQEIISLGNAPTCEEDRLLALLQAVDGAN